jgi:hypothetical protein
MPNVSSGRPNLIPIGALRWIQREHPLPITAAAAGQTIAIGQATETDSAQPITWAPKNRLVRQATETDSAQAIAHRKLKAIGQPVENDSAQVITPALTGGGQTIAVAQATETDSAQAITHLKTKALGQPVETDSAQAITHRKAKALGQPFETDSAQPITAQLSSGQTILLGQAVETDTAQIVTVLLSGGVDAGIDGSGLRFIRRYGKHHENQARLYNEYLDRLEAQRKRRPGAPSAQVLGPVPVPPGGGRGDSQDLHARATADVDSVLAEGLRAVRAGEVAALEEILEDDDEVLVCLS